MIKPKELRKIKIENQNKNNLKRKIGHPREPIDGIKKIIDQKKANINESWPSFGDSKRFYNIYIDALKGKPLIHLEKIKNKNPQIMVLGAGGGQDIILLKEYLEYKNIFPDIDVFSLTKSLDKNIIETNTVKNDYSFDTPLESIDPENPKHKKIIDKLIGKYDLVMAPLSVGMYTKYPAVNIFRTALLLKKGGKAYIEIEPFNNTMTTTKHITFITFRDTSKTKEYHLAHLEEIFNKMVNYYNKIEKKNNKYILKYIRHEKEPNYCLYIEIERIN
ncbi:MAG TPA: hypothetical protein PLN85_03965 [archaeon]|nr:hypothetical protein [archaeon]